MDSQKQPVEHSGSSDCSSANYKTRCGYPVRIYATDGGMSRQQIQGAVFTDMLGWSMFHWMPNGQAYSTDPIHDYDLVDFKPSEKHYIACEDWIRERWGGFTHLVIGRNEDFMLDFKDGSLWLHCETEERNSPVSRVLLFEKPTRQSVIETEKMFGCK